MRGQRGQGGRKKTVPGVLTDAQAEEFSRDAVPPPAMTPVVDNMLHDDAMRMYKEQERLSAIENRHARRNAEEQLEIGKASLTITMMEYNLPRREWDDGLCIEWERYCEERGETVRGTAKIIRK
jgi:hypothetical protein